MSKNKNCKRDSFEFDTSIRFHLFSRKQTAKTFNWQFWKWFFFSFVVCNKNIIFSKFSIKRSIDFQYNIVFALFIQCISIRSTRIKFKNSIINLVDDLQNKIIIADENQTIPAPFFLVNLKNILNENV